ncbi:MAG: preprotein translocase subunit SecE [Candidatus Melainabacteria bacterium]|jgi:preprotein translocase SecE subunit|nr:preprotein translocase subunit SecE [Candidatus Melainabacteria bacterium]
MSTKKKDKGSTPSTNLTEGDGEQETSEKNAVEAKARDEAPHKEKKVKDDPKNDPKKSKKEKKALDDTEIELGESLKDIRQFLKDVVVEFTKITWPPRGQVLQETWSVLFLVALITLLVLGFDWFLAHAIFGPLEHWARLHGGGVGLPH